MLIIVVIFMHARCNVELSLSVYNVGKIFVPLIASFSAIIVSQIVNWLAILSN